MAQTLVVLNEQDFNCPICLDLLEDPISIPCGHSYCRSCICEHWTRNTHLETVSCPQCRESFSPMPHLGRNIVLAETLEKLKASNREQAASPVPITNRSSAATDVQRPHTSSTTMKNVRQSPSSTTVTNVQGPRTSSTTVMNVRQQRASASVSSNVQQQRASALVFINSPQGPAIFVSEFTNVQRPRTSASVIKNVQWPRVLALLFSCIAFGFAFHCPAVRHKQVGEWCIFCWGFSFSGTALVLLVELCGLQSRTPFSWKNFPITFACFASVFCLTASILFAVYFKKGFFTYDDVSYKFCQVSLVFSCLATIAYLTEVAISKALSNNYRDTRTGYMSTVPGLLKVYETSVALFIFVFICNPNSYESNAPIKWCMAVYCICFILSCMVILKCLRNSTAFLSPDSTAVLCFYALVATIMYLTAVIIWPIYKFDRDHGGDSTRPSWCTSASPILCPFDKLIVVSVLTGVNLILYLVDLMYSIKLSVCD